MRLRRLELAFITVTLAFAIFMGGFFAGRSWSTVNISPVSTVGPQSHDNGRVSVQSHGLSQERPVSSDASANPGGPESASEYLNPQTNIAQEPFASPETEIQQEIGAPRGGDGKININIATQSELTDLPGIGATLASRIVDYRRQHGDFQRIEDIRNVSGIGEKRYEAIEHMITVLTH